MMKGILILYIFITKELILSNTNNEDKQYSFLISICGYDIVSVSVKESEEQELKKVDVLKDMEIERVNFEEQDDYLLKFLDRGVQFYLVSFKISNDYTIPVDKNTIMDFIVKYKPKDTSPIVEKPLLRVDFKEILSYSENLNVEILSDDQNPNQNNIYTQRLFLLHEQILYPTFITINTNDFTIKTKSLKEKTEFLERIFFYFENYNYYQGLTKDFTSLYGFMSTQNIKNELDKIAKTFNPLSLNISKIEQINTDLKAIHTIFSNENKEIENLFNLMAMENTNLLTDFIKSSFLDSINFFYLSINRLIKEMFFEEGSEFFIVMSTQIINKEPSEKEIYLKFLQKFEKLRPLEKQFHQYLMTQSPETKKLIDLTISFDEILYSTVTSKQQLNTEESNLTNKLRELEENQHRLKYEKNILINDIKQDITTNVNNMKQLNEPRIKILEMMIELVNLETERTKLEDFYLNYKLPSLEYCLSEVKKTLKQKKKKEKSEFEKDTVTQLEEFIKTYPSWKKQPIHLSIMFLAENNDKINQLISLYGTH